MKIIVIIGFFRAIENFIVGSIKNLYLHKNHVIVIFL